MIFGAFAMLLLVAAVDVRNGTARGLLLVVLVIVLVVELVQHRRDRRARRGTR